MVGNLRQKTKEDFPFSIQVGFKKVIDAYKNRLKTEKKPLAKKYLKELLEYIEDFPELETGIDDLERLSKFEQPIITLLDDLFPDLLTENEIKAAAVPKTDIFLAISSRFERILKEAGKNFELTPRNFDKQLDYVSGCVLILNSFYNYKIDFSRPIYYDIPNKEGIIKTYRLSVNADFIQFHKTDSAPKITDADVDELLLNPDDLKIWKEKFPPNSYIFKGFTLLNLTDITIDDGISDLKSELLNKKLPESTMASLIEIFRSIFKIPDLQIGFTLYDQANNKFVKMSQDKSSYINSFILDQDDCVNCPKALCQQGIDQLIEKKENFVIANVEQYATKTQHNLLAENLLAKGIKSSIFAPVARGNDLMGVLELGSLRKNELNRINASKLDDILPYIVMAVERNKAEFENRIKAVIQSECTSIHPSVLWVFEQEAERYINDLEQDGIASFRDIGFKDIYPLYGQIDIVGSSDERNRAIQKDLLSQLQIITKLVEKAFEIESIPIYEQIIFRINEFKKELKENLNASSEQRIMNFIYDELDPLIEHIYNNEKSLRSEIDVYKEDLNSQSGVIYNHRKNYDDTVQRINRSLSRYLDRQQQEAQKMYPHYFERYKTDGVEHNMYIGAAMVNNRPFHKVYLYNLRLWQLQTMCEMENKFYSIQEDLPLKLDAASLILVFSSTLSIKYRMDEKKFDVDGTYNARYEIIKKRIDKAFIKNTEERITQKGKIAIIYSQKTDELEYLRYINYLQKKDYLGEEIEKLELEDVQGVIGLKALRVRVLYHLPDEPNQIKFTYEDLMNEINP
ncbi:GAF domain-containing protein [uncultured Mesonia sp.]|uniref:GAF domain-containing protein n=1 Tax=uncultured Mesonia sp. TaxID=399731 RepID=UPI00374F7B19